MPAVSVCQRFEPSTQCWPNLAEDVQKGGSSQADWKLARRGRPGEQRTTTALPWFCACNPAATHVALSQAQHFCCAASCFGCSWVSWQAKMVTAKWFWWAFVKNLQWWSIIVPDKAGQWTGMQKKKKRKKKRLPWSKPTPCAVPGLTHPYVGQHIYSFFIAYKEAQPPHSSFGTGRSNGIMKGA